MPWLGVVSYGAAALLYGIAAVVVLAGRPHSSRARCLAIAIVASSLWAAGLALSSIGMSLSAPVLVGLDAVHLFVWTTCVLFWLAPPSARRRLVGASAGIGLLAVMAAWPAAPVSVADTSYPALVLMALIGFLSIEQVYRNAQEEARPHLKLLCLAVGGIVTVDLIVYSNAALLGGLQPLLWSARGFANAAVLPLIVLGSARQSGWEREPFVSRQVVFYTASLLGVGGYLVAMGLAAYFIRAIGREWSFPLDIVFVLAGIGVLLVVLFSSNIRARLKVSLVKHFYRSKYDYREEWLRLTQSLSRTGDLEQSALNGLEGMARIIGSQHGDLWIERDGHRYEWLVSLSNTPPAQMHFERRHPLVSFLASSGWVVDSEEYAREPDKYGTAFGHPDDGLLPLNSLIVPLERQGYLQGFVVLRKPAGLASLNFEDHDILKTVGRQIAAVLAQALGQEKLAETRQFETLNRLSTFLMHDLKNIVAQQELVVANAKRFRHRPDFIDDAFATIDGGTKRIKKVLEQLAAASRTQPASGRVDVSKVLMEVRSQCSDRSPVPQIDLQAQPAWVRMDRDQVASVLLHLVRNAQDATPAGGRIDICVSKEADEILITVADTGCGMDAGFIRDRLFRPFDSTKGPTGMGIGAYQARHLVRLAGGELDVKSDIGVGSTFTVRLPTADWSAVPLSTEDGGAQPTEQGDSYTSAASKISSAR
ncbi:MAG TPA: XrtA/PEP-CTERM system histidine kinase PrsK [Gammaproteobacteria bacterium]